MCCCCTRPLVVLQIILLANIWRHEAVSLRCLFVDQFSLKMQKVYVFSIPAGLPAGSFRGVLGYVVVFCEAVGGHFLLRFSLFLGLRVSFISYHFLIN